MDYKKDNQRRLHGAYFGLWEDLHLDPRNNPQQAQRRRRSKPLLTALISLYLSRIPVPVYNLQRQHAANHHGILPQRRAMRPHGDAPSQRNVPVHQARADVGAPFVQILGELEKRHAALDHDAAAFEVKVGDAVDKLGADHDGLVVGALRVVPHVAFAAGTHLQAAAGGVFDERGHLGDAGCVVDLDDVVA